MGFHHTASTASQHILTTLLYHFKFGNTHNIITPYNHYTLKIYTYTTPRVHYPVRRKAHVCRILPGQCSKFDCTTTVETEIACLLGQPMNNPILTLTWYTNIYTCSYAIKYLYLVESGGNHTLNKVGTRVLVPDLLRSS